MATRRLRITKEPQCRHSESQGFVSYTSAVLLGLTTWTAHCSNCNRDSASGCTTKEQARLDLMRIEAPPIVVP